MNLIKYNIIHFKIGSWFTKLYTILYPIFILFVVFFDPTFTTVTDNTLWSHKSDSQTMAMVVFFLALLVIYPIAVWLKVYQLKKSMTSKSERLLSEEEKELLSKILN